MKYLLINVYSSGETAPYVAKTEVFATHEAALRWMKDTVLSEMLEYNQNNKKAPRIACNTEDDISIIGLSDGDGEYRDSWFIIETE